MKITKTQLKQIIKEELSRALIEDSSQGEDPNPYVVVNYIPLTTSTGKRRDADIDGHVTYIDKEFDDKEELEATIARGGYWFDDYGDEITGDDASDLWAALDKYISSTKS